MLRIVPQKMYEELKHIKSNFPTYAALKNHVRSLVVEKLETTANRPSLQHIEPEEREARGQASQQRPIARARDLSCDAS